ncbi:hypothetical protein BS47DRAFT_1329667 [Hydnum rufescens UP504]|uniref:Diphthine--ammonia ligase n=1 Tax=Hydnum rufescens UP504 TaxID=1448309 RepID=A0A9P6AXS2_9AGAM|nr:hypothetical protein BS47DRAFT_1329667 [Hydnum rufescens UP504]
MHIVALLSGGKDSCYNLVHCAENGHVLVAAASLGPALGREEIDSYMYQTVGQDAIELVAQALGVPLYRRVIAGSALAQGSEYGSRKANVSQSSSSGIVGDETEDLYQLLLTVKDEHPEIEGVSVGAILSNYQRVRVEHVCRRLSLTVLCYLWQRDQRELLSEMICAGVDAVLIKVAGIGLLPKHLGMTLKEMEPTLQNLNDLYGSHICGEGGEYETLTLDCPVFKRRIQLHKTEVVIHSFSDIGPVAYLRILNGTLAEKDQGDMDTAIIVPSLLDPSSQMIVSASPAVDFPHPTILADYKEQNMPINQHHSIRSKQECWVSISNVQVEDVADLSIENECAGCWRITQSKLAEHFLDISHISHVNVYLSSMDHFPHLNAVMYKIFGTSPPTRACVGVDLLPPNRVRLDIIAFSQSNLQDRRALHVQSLSYWAPANIGPYSQSVTVRERMFVSGQIGLQPGSMTFPSPRSISLETALALQHTRKIASAMSEILGPSRLGRETVQRAILWLPDANDIGTVGAAWRLSTESYGLQPTGLIVGVKQLPRDALVEAQLLYSIGMESDDSDADENESLTQTRGKHRKERGTAWSTFWEDEYYQVGWEVLASGGTSCALVTFKRNPRNNSDSPRGFAVSSRSTGTSEKFL